DKEKDMGTGMRKEERKGEGDEIWWWKKRCLYLVVRRESEGGSLSLELEKEREGKGMERYPTSSIAGFDVVKVWATSSFE
ncbi:hypothetical protein ACH5RR_000814, partial [Cinchona calisaya]